MKLHNLSRTHQLALGAVMAAINVVFAIFSSYLFAFSLLIMLFLPLASIIVAINIDIKYYLVYFLGTMLLALVLNLANIENTLFFLLPILTSGLAFGFLIRVHASDILLLLGVSAVNLLTLLITIPVINLIYSIDFLNVFASFIGFNDLAFGNLILPSVLTLLAFMQTLITLIIITMDAKYFRIEIISAPFKYIGLVTLFFLVLVIIFMFFFENIALALLFITLFLSVYELLLLFEKNKTVMLISLTLAVAFTFIGIAIFENNTPLPFYFGIIIGVIPIVIGHNIWLYISNKKKEEKDGGII